MEGAAGDRGETLFGGPSFILRLQNGASLTPDAEGAALADSVHTAEVHQRSSQYNKYCL